MHLDFVIQLVTDEGPVESLNVVEDLKESEALLHLRAERDVELVAIWAELLLKHSPQLLVKDGAVGPSSRHEHTAPQDVFLHLFEWVIHRVLVPQIDPTVVLQAVEERVKDREELEGLCLEVPQFPLLDQRLLIKLHHETDDEIFSTLLKVISVDFKLLDELFVLLI